MLASGIVGLAEGASRRWLAQEPRPDVGQVATLISDLAWAGLRGLHATR